MIKSFRALAQIVAAALLNIICCLAMAQQAYPNKPIRFISPNPPGGGTSALGRLVGEKLTESWGQQVILDNRPGANGFIGGSALAKSPPDGYTAMVITSTHIITPLLYPPPYDPIKDFAAVASLTKSQLVLSVHPAVAANNLTEFIALLKAKPGQLNQGSSGEGSWSGLAGAYFDMTAGTRMQHIPYKGTGQLLTDLLGGQVQLSFSPALTVIPYIQAGRLRALAISGENRSQALPQVPTFAEAGMPGFDVKTWYGLIAPVGTPKEIIDKFATEIGKIMSMPDIKDKLIGHGMEPFISPPEQYAALMKTDMARFANIIKAANVQTSR